MNGLKILEKLNSYSPKVEKKLAVFKNKMQRQYVKKAIQISEPVQRKVQSKVQVQPTVPKKNFQKAGNVRSPKQSYYNLKGIIITKEDIENIVGVPIKNHQLFINAFCHKSYTIASDSDSEPFNGEFEITDTLSGETTLFQPTENYDRLEFMGDSIFNGIVTEYLLLKFPEIDQGTLTIYRSKIIRNDHLSSFVVKLGLDQFLLIQGEDREKLERAKNPSKIAGDIFESFIGALYWDYTYSFHDPAKAFQVCRRFIWKMIDSYVDFNEITEKNTNYNDQLLQYYQRHSYGQPIYQVITSPVYEEFVNEKGYTETRCIRHTFETCVSLYSETPKGIDFRFLEIPNTVKQGDTLRLFLTLEGYSYTETPGSIQLPNFQQTIVGIGSASMKQQANHNASEAALKYLRMKNKEN